MTIEEIVRTKLGDETRVVAAYLPPLNPDAFIVLWFDDEGTFGTHQGSVEREALWWGHYGMSAEEGWQDFIERKEKLT
jgi:hypothetical protein